MYFFISHNQNRRALVESIFVFAQSVPTSHYGCTTDKDLVAEIVVSSWDGRLYRVYFYRYAVELCFLITTLAQQPYTKEFRPRKSIVVATTGSENRMVLASLTMQGYVVLNWK